MPATRPDIDSFPSSCLTLKHAFSSTRINMSHQPTVAEAQQNLTALEHLALSRRALLSAPRHAALHAQGLLQAAHTPRSLLWGTLAASEADEAAQQSTQRRLPTYFEQHSPACKACAMPLVPGITSHRSRAGKQRCSGCTRSVGAWSAEADAESKQQLPPTRKRRRTAAPVKPAPTAAPRTAPAAQPAPASGLLNTRTLEASSKERKLKKSLLSAPASASGSSTPTPAPSSTAPAPSTSTSLAPSSQRPSSLQPPRTLDDQRAKKKKKDGAAAGAGADKAALRAMLASSKRKEEADSAAKKEKKGGGLMDFLGAL